MSKRFATIFFITVATIMILCVVFFLVLFLAPGFSMFGIKYIGKNLHAYDTGKVDLYTRLGASYTEYEINTYEVPVYVIFSENRNFELEYYDNYNGITNSKIQDPSIEIKTQGGKVVITTTEFHKCIYETSTSERFLKFYVPLSETSGLDADGVYTLQINSTKSSVYFSKAEPEDERIPNFDTVGINTKGKIHYDTTMVADTYKLETSSSISIDKDKSNIISATNYNLKTTSGKINIESPIDGDLTLETKNGSISLISCKNLYAKTTYGKIQSAGENPVSISGVVDISTTAGSVILGTVEGVGENKIATGSGKVVIDKIGDGTITTKRGSVDIKSVQNFKIETNVGKVTVQESLGSIDVTTKRGDIILGGDGITLTNAKAFSRLGRVYVKSATGTVNIETISSNVEFKNATSDDITIKCGGKLKAEELSGKVNVRAEKDSTIRFTTINDVSVLEFGDGCKNVEVYALNNTKDDIGYLIYGSSIKIQEWKNNAYITFDGMSGSNRDQYVVNQTSGTYLKLTSKANVSLYFKAPN